jgi:hypothetical protein
MKIKPGFDEAYSFSCGVARVKVEVGNKEP